MSNAAVLLTHLFQVSWSMLYGSLSAVQDFLASYEFLFLAETIAVIVKVSVLAKLFKYITNSKKFEKLWLFLVLAIIGSLAEDLTWIIKILEINVPEFDKRIWIMFVRVSWVLALITT